MLRTLRANTAKVQGWIEREATLTRIKGMLLRRNLDMDADGVQALQDEQRQLELWLASHQTSVASIGYEWGDVHDDGIARARLLGVLRRLEVALPCFAQSCNGFELGEIQARCLTLLQAVQSEMGQRVRRLHAEQHIA